MRAAVKTVPAAPPPSEPVKKSRLKKGRRTLPWLVLVLWIGVLAVAVPLAGKLEDVQKDTAVSYLPANADSTQVAKLQEKLPGGESTDLVIVYHRDGGLTDADRGTAAGQISQVAQAHKLTGAPEPVESADKTTVMYPVSTTEPGQDEDARTKLVDDVRKVATSGQGLTVEVGGPGAFDVDGGKVYDSLGGPLLYTTVIVVAVLLIIIYRSPVLWLVPLLAAGAADVLSMAVTYGLAKAFGITVSGQSSGIMTILVFGVGTDYALLLVARYREELRRTEAPFDAMQVALRRSAPAVIASAGTVALGMFCLLAADLNSSRGVGPAAAVGVLCALLAMMTLLPAVLLLFGRRIFWPLVPAFGSEPKNKDGLFARTGTAVSRRPAAVLTAGLVLLGALALGVFQLAGSVKQEDSFTSKPDSIAAMQTLEKAFPEQNSQAIEVMAPTARASEVETKAKAVAGVSAVQVGRDANGWTELSVTTTSVPESAAETATIKALRDALKGSYVGGPSAQQLDLQDTNARDRLVVIPIVLAAVLLILIALLRSLIAPLILVAAVVAVWGAALGIGGLVFEPLFGFHGTDPGLPLLSFVFLVALGVDYGIFLAHRMREEALSGADPNTATLNALRSTGGVITSAGIVLAATFAVLMNMPMVQLAELGFVISIGVLLDTFIVRTFLVTSASFLLGRKVWWPGPLSRPTTQADR